MADVALNAARSKAPLMRISIGRYLNQFIITRENKVLNVVDTSLMGWVSGSSPMGAGFLGYDKLDKDSIARSAELAVSIAKENARLQSEPVQLAPQKGYGE